MNRLLIAIFAVLVTAASIGVLPNQTRLPMIIAPPPA
jgi:hypothetical protein